MDTEKLIDVGLSRAEALVYLALLKLGKTKSGNLIKITELQSSVVHNSLNSLINRGFVTYILEDKVKRYIALDPKIIEKYLDSKKQEFREILPELESIRKTTEIITAQVYEGFKGLYTATISMIQNYKKGDIYKYFAAEKTLLSDGAIEFFQKVDLMKKSKNIVIRGIAKTSDKELLKEYKNSQIRYVNTEIPPAMNIFKDKILIISLSGKPVGILIQSKEIANQYHELWDNCWKISKR